MDPVTTPLLTCYWCKQVSMFISSNRVFAFKDGSPTVVANCCYNRECKEKHEKFTKENVNKCEIPAGQK